MLNDILRAAVARGELGGLHGVLVLHRGETLAEVYFPGRDENWGMDLGVVRHGPETLHDVRSITKSVVGLLYGIALAEGIVPPLTAPLIAQFPHLADLAADPARAGVRVEHALAMLMGLEWDEELPYTDPRNSEIAMERAPDRIRYVLSRPVVAAPGALWTYGGGAVAVIARLIEMGAGMKLDAYARTRLFAPLGINRWEWARGLDGTPSAASGLRLTARGLARIGRMIAAGGAWGGVQVVPASWLDASLAPRATLDGLRYGYLWWLAGWGTPPAWVAGFGNGGQRLTVQRGHDLVIVVQGGRYNQTDAWRLPAAVIDSYVVPAVTARLGR